MPPAKKKSPPKASEMSLEAVDYSAVVKALTAAKAAFLKRFPQPHPSESMIHLSGKRYVRYTSAGRAAHAAALRAIDKAAQIAHEVAAASKVLEQ